MSGPYRTPWKPPLKLKQSSVDHERYVWPQDRDWMMNNVVSSLQPLDTDSLLQMTVAFVLICMVTGLWIVYQPIHEVGVRIWR